MPVSETANGSQAPGSRSTVRVRVPWSVNLAALESRLTSVWRSFVRSACMLPMSCGLRNVLRNTTNRLAELFGRPARTGQHDDEVTALGLVVSYPLPKPRDE